MNTTASPLRHHLDRRGEQIASQIVGDDDELLSTSDVAELLGVSHQFLEIGRHRGYGPKFVRVSARVIRYSRSAVRAWLLERQHQCVSEYTASPIRKAVRA